MSRTNGLQLQKYTFFPTQAHPRPAGRQIVRRPIFLTRKIDYFRASAPTHANERKSETADVQAHPREPPPPGRPKTPFSPLYGTFRPQFSVRTSLGSENPWDGSPDPWDGNQNPRDGATGQPPCAAFPTLKGGARRVSALTVCHIAHKVSRAAERPPQPKPHREAGDPIGVEPSITAGEPKANPRKGPTL